MADHNGRLFEHLYVASLPLFAASFAVLIDDRRIYLQSNYIKSKPTWSNRRPYKQPYDKEQAKRAVWLRVGLREHRFLLGTLVQASTLLPTTRTDTVTGRDQRI